METDKLLKVEGYESLARDPYSRAIINTNNGAYEAAVKRANAAKKKEQDLRDATREINNIKSEMHEIKSLLMKLLEK